MRAPGFTRFRTPSFPLGHRRRPPDHVLRLHVIDPLISIAISLFIAREIYKIVRQTVNSLLDAVHRA